MNNKRILGSLLTTVCTVAIVAVTPALAQVEEIVVTARKKAESLQDVPISITAYSAQMLENAGIRDVNDLANFTSNMTFSHSESGRINTPTIRGMSMIDTRGFDNNVSVFIDGVFVSGRAAQNQGMLDLERVEVVKGPQSALYGRNSFAGAINYVTKRPGDEFEGKVELTVGEDEFYQVLGSVSGPLVENKLAGRLVAKYDEDGGTYKNAPGGDIGGHENKTIMGTLRFTPNDVLDISLDAYYADEVLDQMPLTIDPNNCGVLPISTSSASYQAGFPYWHCGEVKGASSDVLNISPAAFASKSDTKRLSLNIEWDVGDYTVTSISAYTENDSHGMTDLDRTDRGAEHYGYITKAEYDDMIFVLPLIVAPDMWGFPPLNHPEIRDFEADTYIGSQGLDQEYASQELRIESNPEERLRGSAGAYYFKSTNTQTASFNVDVSEAIAMSGLSPEELVFVTSDPGNTAFGPIGVVHPVLDQQWETSTPIWTNGTIENNEITQAIEKARQYALFGSVEYDLSEQLTGTVELRWTKEKRSLHDRKDAFFHSLDAYGPGGSYNQIEHDYLDPRFTLAYQINDDHMLYGSASKGTRSGGINGNLAPDVDPFYDPEKNWTYEIGTKTTWLDGKLQFNAAAFYIDWTDAQFRQLIGETLLTKVSNSTGIEVRGAEFDFVYAPLDGLLISGGYGYSDAEFNDGTLWTGGTRLCQGTADNGGTPAFSDCVAPVPPLASLDDRYEDNIITYPNMSGLMPKRSSKHTANIAVEYSRHAFGEIDGFVRADAAYRSKQYVDEANSSWVPDRTLVNLRTGFQSEKYDLIFWVTNLFEEDAPAFAQQFGTDFNNFNTTSSAVNIPQRRFGVTGRYRF